MTNRTLLIVEDDAVFANRMGDALSARGFDVRRALSKHEALAALGESPPDFALIDLRLADGSGLDVLTALHAVRPTARAIVLSGYGNVRCAAAAIRAGAFDCLPKPADADEVAAAFLAGPGALPAPPYNPLRPNEARRLHIAHVLEECGGNISQAARRLSMHRRTLQRILGRPSAEEAGVNATRPNARFDA